MRHLTCIFISKLIQVCPEIYQCGTNETRVGYLAYRGVSSRKSNCVEYLEGKMEEIQLMILSASGGIEMVDVL